MKTVSVALSGGGIAGLGHVPILAALDELGVKPVAMAGTSMGAVIAACYAAGMTGAEIEDYVRGVANSPFAHVRRFLTSGWHAGLSSTADGRILLETVLPAQIPSRIEEMEIPLQVVATDFLAKKSAIFGAGDTVTALCASMAIPGVFRPVEHGGRIYVDGGVTNNLPVDVLPKSDVVLGVDVATLPEITDTTVPGPMGNVTSSIRIMLHVLMQNALDRCDNLLLIQPGSRHVGALDLARIEEALDLAHADKEDAKRKLAAALEAD